MDLTPEVLRAVTSVAQAGAKMDAPWAREQLRRRYLFPSEVELNCEDEAKPGEAPQNLGPRAYQVGPRVGVQGPDRSCNPRIFP